MDALMDLVMWGVLAFVLIVVGRALIVKWISKT